MPDSSQIALTLFADIRDAPNGPAKFHACFPGCAQNPEQSDKACAIVGDAGQMKHTSGFPEFQLHVAWKDGVEMRADNHGIRAGLAIGNQDIAESVAEGRESVPAQRLQEMAAPFRF